MEKVYLGAGCFWGVEASLKEIQGVVDTTVGYGGGDTENPSYEQVCDGDTNHVELVEVVYDDTLDFVSLLKAFFSMHNPTTKNRQGLDVGSQYRSAIYTTTSEQFNVAKRVLQDLDQSGKYSVPIVTEISAFKNFYVAEDYHQDYLDKNPGMCHI